MNDTLFEQLDNYYPRINFTIKLNPKKFLDTKLICVNSIYNSMFNRKSTKLSIAWSSKLPKCYKHKSLFGFYIDEKES